MKMNESGHKRINIQKIPSKWKYIITAITLLFLIFTAFLYALLTDEPKPDPASEKIIREAAAKQLGKDPNELTDEDFTKITTFYLSGKELFDIKLLEKFTNLKELDFHKINFPKDKIPKWMKFLAKLGIFDLKSRFTLDLSPIGNLHKLESIYIDEAPVSNIEPLKFITSLKKLRLDKTQIKSLKPVKNLKNLRELYLNSAQIYDLEPLRQLTNLQMLWIVDVPVSDLEPVKGLTNLYNLSLQRTRVYDLEPIKEFNKLFSLALCYSQVNNLETVKGFTNLQTLNLDYTQVSNLEPLKELQNLTALSMSNCPNITDEQVKDLQKALPKLSIER
jgi:Leucine-rich repeat (LRR) protein